MIGAITSRDVLLHPMTTIGCFGWRVFFRAVSPWSNITFLSVLEDADWFGGGAAQLPPILDRCIELEMRAKRIYMAFAKRFAEDPVETGAACRFFYMLARQEQEHADLLSVCRAVASRGHWQPDRLAPWQDRVALLEDDMHKAEVSAVTIRNVDDALGLTLAIESSEVNQIFQAIVTAADSPFVQSLAPFRRAMQSHTDYLCERIPPLSPHLAQACEALRTKIGRAA